LTPVDLLTHLNAEGLSKYDMPEFFVALDRMPLTSNGKILKRELNDWIDRHDVDPKPVSWQAPS
jgi:non-ribosomal peptide synthetase component E (peptide arylation enzyme)